MATLLDPIKARLSAILAGTYPTAPADPYLPAATFLERKVFVPVHNPLFPGGVQRAQLSRKFDLAWESMDAAPSGTPNGRQGPWLREVRFTLTVQYESTRPPALAPNVTEFTLGALESATRHALDDAMAIEWALLQPEAWTGVAVGYRRLSPVTASKADSLRAVSKLAAVVIFQQSAAARPDLWSP